VAEKRIPSGGRTRERLVADLRAVLDEVAARGSDLRIEEWWDATDPEVWVRSTLGPRVRWSIRVEDDGYRIEVRGPLLARLLAPPPLRRLLRALRRV
jgi:hypothetical protein